MKIILLSGNLQLAEFDNVRHEAMPRVVRYLGEIFVQSHPLTKFLPPEAGEKRGQREILGFYFQLSPVQDLRAADAVRDNRHFA